MNNEKGEVGGRKPYEPPQLKTINLRPKEAVLGHCKISGSGGPIGGNCMAVTCMTIGS